MVLNTKAASTALFLLAALAPSYFTLRAQSTPRTIEVHAHRFAFVPAEITVKQGESVKLVLISDDVPHSLTINDLGINQTIVKDHATEFPFTPAKSGDFKGQCGRFCGSGHGQMLFTVHVKPG